MYSTTYYEYKFTRVFEKKQAKVLAEAMVEAYDELVKTKDFNELKSIVKELATTQQRTEQRMDGLVKAQERTEQRIDALTKAQGQTEQSIKELAIAQQRTEKSMEELTKTVQQLAREHDDTRKQVGGLAMTVGYTLENKAYKALPHLLERDFNLILQTPLKRTYLTDNKGYELEVNITGQAEQQGKMVTIIGESKTQLSKSKIDSFIRKRLKRFEGVIPEIFPLLVTHMTTSSDVEVYAKEKGIAVYYSYDFE